MTQPNVRGSTEPSHVSRYGIALVAAASALLATAPKAHAQLTYNTFISGSSLFTAVGNNATIGFSYDVDKFVGSVLQRLQQQPAVRRQSRRQRRSPVLARPFPARRANCMYSQLTRLVALRRATSLLVRRIGQVYQVPADGSAPSLFATVPVGGVRSISFDPYGLYGNDMIVATNAGFLYEVNSAGAVSQLGTSFGEDAEGLTFAPENFGPFAKGERRSGSEGSGSLRAIDPNGTAHIFATVPSAEMLSFVPLNLGSSGNPVEGFTPRTIRRTSLRWMQPIFCRSRATS